MDAQPDDRIARLLARSSYDPPPMDPQLDNVLGDIAKKFYNLHPNDTNIRDPYILGRELGQGSFWSTYLCIKKFMGEHFACKSIPKATLTSKGDQEAFRRGIEIMDGLKDKKNVAQMMDAFEDHLHVHIVMDPCSGGDLFQGITQREEHYERDAAVLMKIIVGVLDRCHSDGVMLRVLNHKTFMFGDNTQLSSLKLFDLGRCVTFQPGPVLPDNISHFRYLPSEAYCIAPEVARGHCGLEADVWSAGVLMYMLLSGVPPFWARTRDLVYYSNVSKVLFGVHLLKAFSVFNSETDQELFYAAAEGHLDFESDPWLTVSDSAKSLIRKMLCPQPSERITAREVLSHPWICETQVPPDDRELGAAVISGLKKFIAKNEARKKD